MTRTILIRAIVGSLRADSLNRKLMSEAIRLAPPQVRIEPLEFRDLPLFDDDLDGDDAPAPVRAFREAITGADGLLIATPEYNHGVPGGLKNALDWASRPPGRSTLIGKPVACFAASPGAVGGARALGQLGLVLIGTLSRPMPGPQVAIGNALAVLGDDGRVTDERTRQRLEQLVRDFAAWIERLGE